MGLSAETSAQDPDNSVCNGYSLNKTEGYWKIMSDAGSLRCCFFTAALRSVSFRSCTSDSLTAGVVVCCSVDVALDDEAKFPGLKVLVRGG